MSGESVEAVVRRAIRGDATAVAWIAANSETSKDAVVLTMAALLDSQPRRLDRASALARDRRDRQMVAIARAHLTADVDLVYALARDHLLDFPDSYVVAWIASGR